MCNSKSKRRFNTNKNCIYLKCSRESCSVQHSYFQNVNIPENTRTQRTTKTNIKEKSQS